MRIAWLIPAMLLGGCSLFTSPLDRMHGAAQDLVSAANEGQANLCAAQADQATALGRILQPSELNKPSAELENLQHLLQRFLGAE